MIEFQHVSKVYGTGRTAVRVINDLSFVLPAGAFWALMGPSGSGKSTVLHLAAGLTAPTSGHVVVDGQDVARMSGSEAARHRRRRVGYVLQSFGLLPFLSAARNVAMPLILDGVPRSDVATRVREALDLVGLASRMDHLPSQLSGGEQQRVAIARALVIRPAIVLADEPTGNLDRTNGAAIMQLIQEINERLSVTVLLVTHDPVFASDAQRILRLVDGVIVHQTDLAASAETGRG
jgi:putative ABC transport system ATP-binding protein